MSFSPRLLMLRPAPWAARGPTTQLKSAEVVSLSWRELLSWRPTPTLGCQVRPRPAEVCSDSWRVLCREAKVFRPAQSGHLLIGYSGAASKQSRDLVHHDDKYR